MRADFHLILTPMRADLSYSHNYSNISGGYVLKESELLVRARMVQPGWGCTA
jgi:hypothetical protein